MEKLQFPPVANTRSINPVQEPQLMPLSYAMPMITARFASPAASACLPQSFMELFFKRK